MESSLKRVFIFYEYILKKEDLKSFFFRKEGTEIINISTNKLECPLEYAAHQALEEAIYTKEKGRILLLLFQKLNVLKNDLFVLSLSFLLVSDWLVK